MGEGNPAEPTPTTSSAAPQTDPHLAKANRYIDDVVAGRIPACKYVRQACQRQRDDLQRFKDDQLYYFDEEKASRVCRFIERLPHIKGPKANARELIVLEPWQCFILTTIFGWRRKDTGGRRYRRVYVEVPRGNAKSTISSGVALYGLAADGEEGAEVYSAATTRGQARIVWGVARQMLLKRPEFAAKLGIIINKGDLQQPRSNSIFTPLSREAKNQDGANLHVGIVDELHAHRTREMYDVLETAMAKRLASLLFVITTAGSDTAGICYEVRGYVIKILERSVDDESQFGIVYTIDERRTDVLRGEEARKELAASCSCGVGAAAAQDIAAAYSAHSEECTARKAKLVGDSLEVERPADDWTKLESWIKANPNWGISVMPDEIAALARKAMQTPAAQANFKTKHLDVWVNAGAAAFDIQAWDRCEDTALSLDAFAGQPCMIGLDLASKIDLAAKVKVFWRDLPIKTVLPAAAPGQPATLSAPKLERHYYFFLDAYLPELAVEQGTNSQYSGWAIEERLITTPGDVLDFAVVKLGVLEDRNRFRVMEIAFDPWQATQLSQELAAEALTTVEVRPTVQNFSAPMKEFDALMRQGRLHHDGNPVFRFAVSNVVAQEDRAGNIYPRKDRPEKKIDPVVASLMALLRAMLAPLNTVSSYLEDQPLISC